MKLAQFIQMLVFTWFCVPMVLSGSREANNHPPGRPPSDPVVERDEEIQEASSLQAQAEAGDPQAQMALGKCCEEGKGMPKDPAEALKWYRKAAEQGNAEAQLYLGEMCYKGKGASKSLEEAFRWYRKAAEQGNPSAQGLLGRMYMRGEGVEQDNFQAYVWFTLAGGNMDMGTYIDSKIVVERLSREQRAKAKSQAEAFVPKPESIKPMPVQRQSSDAEKPEKKP